MLINQLPRRCKFLFWLLFSFYVLIVLEATAFRGELFHILGGDYRMDTLRVYNLYPFQTILHSLKNYGRLGAVDVGNIVMFIPFAFIYVGASRSPQIVYPAILRRCVLTSVGIEMLQFILNTGSFDVDDIILNTVGSCIGLLIYYAFYIGNGKRSVVALQYLLGVCMTFPPFLVCFIRILISELTMLFSQYNGDPRHFTVWDGIILSFYFFFTKRFAKQIFGQYIKHYYVFVIMFSLLFFSILIYYLPC